MPFPPINLHQRITSPGKELFRKKKPNIVPPQSLLTSKAREEKESEKDTLSTSWPSANLKQLGRKPQQPRTKLPTHVAAVSLGTEGKNSWLTLPKPLANSCDSVPRSSSGESATQKSSKHSSRSSLAKDDAEEEIHFSLSLTPEAILVIQKRNLEKQMLAKQQKCCASADFRHRRVFPSKRAQGASKTNVPVAKLEIPEDISTIVKISLLNDQYKYDDVEYEEEDGDVDETVNKSCQRQRQNLRAFEQFTAHICDDRSQTCYLTMTSKGLDIHRTSSLPSILDKYVSPGHIKKDNVKKRHKKKTWGREDGDGEGLPETSHSDPEEEARVRQKAALDQRHLEVYRNMHILQGEMRRRYAALLTEKVSKQRREIKQRALPAPKPSENPREQRGGGAAGRRLPHCTLSHNDTHLKSLPKTGYYLIVDLQNQLARRGCLKTQQDQEEFRSLVGQNRGTACLETRLREIRERMIGGRSAPDLRSVGWTQKETMGPDPAVWITADGRSRKERAVLSEGKARDSRAAHRLQGKHPQERDEIEQMFPKVHVPKFVTLQPGFLDQFKPSTLCQLKVCEPPQKTRTTELGLRKLHLMYSRSFTNIAISQRLLDGKRHCPHWEENSIRSLMQYMLPTGDSRLKQRCTGKPFLPRPSSPPETTPGETPACSPQHSTAPPIGTISAKVTPREAEVDTPNPPEPLTLEEASQQNSVVVIDRLCKTWTNYVENSNAH
ncbi:hypothetical protein AAFF_G00137530 [Aldrovandia affinis]|uniref:Uncharacterized protein n=1 Tax=Aldrovandia affinis TaxID=143900 RepID=A0AAD7TBR9_9TELE|nr:hypothetical protein AAFF_G00137530 [Aldrovandia affinis]